MKAVVGAKLRLRALAVSVRAPKRDAGADTSCFGARRASVIGSFGQQIRALALSPSAFPKARRIFAARALERRRDC